MQEGTSPRRQSPLFSQERKAGRPVSVRRCSCYKTERAPCSAEARPLGLLEAPGLELERDLRQGLCGLNSFPDAVALRAAASTQGLPAQPRLLGNVTQCHHHAFFHALEAADVEVAVSRSWPTWSMALPRPSRKAWPRTRLPRSRKSSRRSAGAKVEIK